MSRGGDTPGTQTLFALEIESGRFISFYFQKGVLYANTDDGSSALWVLDGDGVVIDNISYSIADRATILAQINEHYGTTFTGWSDNEISLSLGDTMPNWNAYEKIEIPKRRVAAKMPSGAEAHFIVGEIENSTFKVYAESSGGIISTSSGLIVATNGPAEGAAQYIIGIFAEYGVTIDSVQNEMVDFEINTYIPNWSVFEIFE